MLFELANTLPTSDKRSWDRLEHLSRGSIHSQEQTRFLFSGLNGSFKGQRAWEGLVISDDSFKYLEHSRIILQPPEKPRWIVTAGEWLESL